MQPYTGTDKAHIERYSRAFRCIVHLLDFCRHAKIHIADLEAEHASEEGTTPESLLAFMEENRDQLVDLAVYHYGGLGGNFDLLRLARDIASWPPVSEQLTKIEKGWQSHVWGHC